MSSQSITQAYRKLAKRFRVRGASVAERATPLPVPALQYMGSHPFIMPTTEEAAKVVFAANPYIEGPATERGQIYVPRERVHTLLTAIKRNKAVNLVRKATNPSREMEPYAQPYTPFRSWSDILTVSQTSECIHLQAGKKHRLCLYPDGKVTWVSQNRSNADSLLRSVFGVLLWLLIGEVTSDQLRWVTHGVAGEDPILVTPDGVVVYPSGAFDQSARVDARAGNIDMNEHIMVAYYPDGPTIQERIDLFAAGEIEYDHSRLPKGPWADWAYNPLGSDDKYANYGPYWVYVDEYSRKDVRDAYRLSNWLFFRSEPLFWI